MAASRIAELASQVQQSVTALDKYMQTHGLPTPSFDEDGPEEFGLESSEAKEARESALAASLELHELLLRPADLLRPIVRDVMSCSHYEFPSAPLLSSVLFFDVDLIWSQNFSTMEQASKLSIDTILLRKFHSGEKFHSQSFLRNVAWMNAI